MNDIAQTSVLIIGGGPAGLTLANLLGTEGVPTVLVERNPGCVEQPRAVALDGESLRSLQATGLAGIVTPGIMQGFIADYVNGEGTFLFSNDLTARPYGYCLLNSFDQPTLERQLLAGLERFDCVEVRHNTQMLDFKQDNEAVTATLAGPDGEHKQLRANYMVGCDGGRSSVRQGLDIAMGGERLPQKWLVIDTVDTHLTEEPECRFYCDPQRPAMTILRPGGERRWEWMLLEGETDDEMLADQRIASLLAPHTDTEKVQVYRKCVYGFSAVVAERFSHGRVFIAGDAAHMTPPFAGQGLNAGIRDVCNLSWKLARVLNGSLPAALLDSYNLERKDAAKAVVDLAVALGDQIQPTDTAIAAERDAFFAELNTDPTAAASFAADLTAPLSDIRLPCGWFLDGSAGGRMLPQPEVTTAGGKMLLDELLGPGFAALVSSARELPASVTEHPLWRALAPSVHYLGEDLTLSADALGSVVDDDKPLCTLVRPDRFVLASVELDGHPAGDLDKLQAAL